MRSAPSRSSALRVLALIMATVVGVLLAAPSGPIGAQIFESSTTSEDEPPPEETTTTSTTEVDGGVIPLPGDDSTTTSEPDDTTTSTTEADFTTTVDEDRPTTTDEPRTTLVPTPTFGGPVVPGPATSTSEPPDEGGGDGLSLGTIVFLIVSAMLVTAALLGWLTWKIWERTRPRLPAGAEAAPPWHRRVAEYLRI